MISCIQMSLQALTIANRNYDQEERRICIVEYNASHRRAIQSGVSLLQINAACGKWHYQCLGAILQAVVIATITGNYYRDVDALLEWYEQDRERMIDLGFLGRAIDKRMKKIKIKLTCK